MWVTSVRPQGLAGKAAVQPRSVRVGRDAFDPIRESALRVAIPEPHAHSCGAERHARMSEIHHRVNHQKLSIEITAAVSISYCGEWSARTHGVREIAQRERWESARDARRE